MVHYSIAAQDVAGIPAEEAATSAIVNRKYDATGIRCSKLPMKADKSWLAMLHKG